MNTGHRHDLQRFVDAQREIFDQVLTELRLGRKQSHWMWFIFPQIKGLGSSAMAQRYALSSLDEAKAYFAHPVLGNRLSMTLFAHAANHHEVFEGALRKYFRSEYDPLTIEGLGFPWPT